MRAHRFEVVDQPWRSVVRVRFDDPADRALEVFLNENPHRRTVALLDRALTGTAGEVAGGGDRMSFSAGADETVITDRLADLATREAPLTDVSIPTSELRGLVEELLSVRAAHRA